MNVLLIGSGGREHTLAWKMSQSEKLGKLYISPGNAGTSNHGINVNLNLTDFDEIGRFIATEEIDMLVIGPEDPLVNGLADYAGTIAGLKVFGPGKAGAMLEGSKDFAKEFMQQYQIPTAAYRSFDSDQLSAALDYLETIPGPYVLKADGLAAGKGVVITESLDQAKKEITDMFSGKFGKAGSKVVIEAFLKGIEFSVFVLTDGNSWKLLPIAKDYKRVGEQDSGLNTGGMGAVSPLPFVDETLLNKVVERIVEPSIHGLKDRNIDYRGVVFLGLINVGGDPYVIEYNCRFGDPETEVVVPRIKNDLIELFAATADRSLSEHSIIEDPRTVATVMICSKGYPEEYAKGFPIAIPENNTHTVAFHAGTVINDNMLQSNGGRVIAVSSWGDDKDDALAKTYDFISKIRFENGFWRTDIGFDL